MHNHKDVINYKTFSDFSQNKSKQVIQQYLYFFAKEIINTNITLEDVLKR